jgi:regulator of protease activity HflC (stomatin/prohibitin superfamily)
VLDRLIDVLIEFIGLFQCWVYIDAFEKGVVLRVGKFHRTIDPGMRWTIPFGIETVIRANAMPDPMYLSVQSLHTADDFQCTVQIGVIWKIIDIKVFLIDNESTEAMVGMLCEGIVRDAVNGSTWEEVSASEFPNSMRAAMNRKVRKRGAEIEEVVIQDHAEGIASRLWHEGIAISVDGA